MGKLGAQELNYASDVDVMLVGEGDTDRLDRAARTLLDLAGRAFRVDLDLRPEGRDGPLVRSLTSYQVYWDRWAQPWERQALLKARPVAGDTALGRAWAGAAATVTWSMPFGADELRQIRSLKVRAEEEARRRDPDGRDVKRGRGGLRDVEFSAQLLQLVHGRVDADLRSAGTLAALDALQAGGYVDPDDADRLAHAYRFLRRVEHALQLEDERQTHEVPDDRDDRRRVARGARVPGHTGRTAPPTPSIRELAGHRATVRSVHERLWFRPLLDALSGAGALAEGAVADRLAAFGFADVERTRQAVTELTRGLTRSSRMMQQLLPLLLDWLSSSPDPDLGLLGLRRLVTGEPRSRALATAFRDSPEVARLLALLLGTSRLLGDVLVANPDLIERLPDPARLRTRPRASSSTAPGRPSPGGRTQRSGSVPCSDGSSVTSSALPRETCSGHATVDQVGHDLASLAEATLEVSLRSLDPAVPVRRGGLRASRRRRAGLRQRPRRGVRARRRRQRPRRSGWPPGWSASWEAPRPPSGSGSRRRPASRRP